jgi:hypothetical protein
MNPEYFIFDAHPVAIVKAQLIIATRIIRNKVFIMFPFQLNVLSKTNHRFTAESAEHAEKNKGNPSAIFASSAVKKSKR